MQVIPLNQMYVNWKGSLTPATFEHLCQGIERENDRLNDSLFIVLLYRRELDYDGFTDYIELLEGFPEKKDVIPFVDLSCEAALSLAIAKPGYGNYQWSIDSSSNNKRFDSRHENQFVKCVHFRSFKLVNGSDFDAIYYEFEALRIVNPQSVGPALFDYLQEESEWINYLLKKGKE